MKEVISIEIATMTDIDKILTMITNIDNKRKNIIKYNDLMVGHKKDSLYKILNGSNKDEIILVAKYKENLIGILDIVFSNPDYIFFIDKYAYIKYFYIENIKLNDFEERETISLKLFNSAINKAKENGFKYLCGDVVEGEDDLKELFRMNSMENYRNRLYKRISNL